jgi:hypothetical protein
MAGRRAKPKRIRAADTRLHGIRRLISAHNLGADRPYRHVKPRKSRVGFLMCFRYMRSL